MAWKGATAVTSRQFKCGHCGSLVASSSGWRQDGADGGAIYLCTHCKQPTYFDGSGKPTPGVPFGEPVGHLPRDVGALYDEARRCTSAAAYTASVLLSRKLLMNIAVEKEAPTGKAFIFYVEYLAERGYVPPNGTGWVDHIRKKGNEATHEITIMGEADAKELLAFSEMLLKFIYEFPSKVPTL